ncbi:uncharacterized protein N0V89_004667 [Didymosphaeria variabile]|uniref:Uncharacterized protein n=1 Tax=Didymosphaeria variabile TaxID=1932322 RepID=A0A9W8XS87_9PLEO|nr:uncharacterized protein N0V89_004667 [Didymosphaeria variabile]KAJ4356631.1 hypothetical protein N0V89_004667 [Didymosphaeria variabile]
MTIHDILAGIEEIKAELKEVTSHLKSVEKRVVRVETLLQQRNDSAVSIPAPSTQGLAHDASGRKDRPQTQASLDLIPDVIPQPTQYHSAAESQGHTTRYDHNAGFSHNSRTGGYQPHQAQHNLPAELPGEPEFVEPHVGENTLAPNTVNYPTLPPSLAAPPPVESGQSRRLHLRESN